ncbi:CYTH domain-containing protein [Sunxiuqinia indica]|uniref:CYTH domain-containing protein n=1 Tax=Sunxiuqinia indica TaxID=2692584 RepID=UPI0013583966|nr:CYTH domain-containing protein [Sunxiuqinia indica]
MAIEIERKFLINEALLQEPVKKISMVQAYLQTDPDRTIRVRIADEAAYLTIKGRGNGISRPEFEYEIPVDDAEELLKLAVYPPVEKDRFHIVVNNRTWEVDFFKGANKGLFLAELELDAENESFEMPVWITKEVTGQEKYHNSYLAKYPFSTWK